MRGRTNVAGKPEEERTVTAGTSAVTVEPTKGKTMKKVTVDPTPSQAKTVTAGTGNVNVSPDSGKLLSGVTVKPTPTQEKTVTPSTSQQTVLPDSGKHLSKVTVKAKPSIKVDGTEVSKAMNLKSFIGTFEGVVAPYSFCDGAAVAIDDVIYIMGGTNSLSSSSDPAYGYNFYKLEDDVWTSIGDLPYKFCRGSAIAIDDEIRIKGGDVSRNGNRYYKFKDGTWTSLGTIGVSIPGNLSGKIGTDDYTFHNKYVYKNGVEMSGVKSPVTFDYGESISVDGKILLFYDTNAYEFDGTSFAQLANVPYSATRGGVGKLPDGIHIFGGYNYPKKHCKFHNDSWTMLEDLRNEFLAGACINNGDSEIHLIGSCPKSSNAVDSHYVMLKAYKEASQ